MGLLRGYERSRWLSHARLRQHLSLPSGTAGTNLERTARYAGENRDPLHNACAGRTRRDPDSVSSRHSRNRRLGRVSLGSGAQAIHSGSRTGIGTFLYGFVGQTHVGVVRYRVPARHLHELIDRDCEVRAGWNLGSHTWTSGWGACDSFRGPARTLDECLLHYSLRVTRASGGSEAQFLKLEPWASCVVERTGVFRRQRSSIVSSDWNQLRG